MKIRSHVVIFDSSITIIGAGVGHLGRVGGGVVFLSGDRLAGLLTGDRLAGLLTGDRLVGLLHRGGDGSILIGDGVSDLGGG